MSFCRNIGAYTFKGAASPATHLPHGALHEDSPHSVLLHTHPCSTEQVLLHPSLSALLPSSHAAFDATRKPSPQLVVHSLGSAVPQSKPHSTVHSAEQPSSASASLSSQVSSPTMMPSPHSDSHVVKPHGTKVQTQPSCRDARTVQSLLHPSSLTVLPSSHASSNALTPSPQLDVH